MRGARGTVARVAAQAKINLVLRIHDRQPNGFHDLETVFARLDLSDDVTVRITEGARALDAAGVAMPAGGIGPVEQNLAWRAATAYAQHTGWPAGFAIEIDKRVPVGGGLGGGSADAGAVLRALNALAPAPVASPNLVTIAAPLGADVPFLTATATFALGTGRGEQITPIATLPCRDILLLQFPFGVPTGDAYRWLEESREGCARPASVHLHPEALRHWGDIAALAQNDFSAVVSSRHPPVREALLALQSAVARTVLGPEGFALLCGSGATVAAIGGETVHADSLASLVPASVEARRIATSTAVRVEEVQVVE